MKCGKATSPEVSNKDSQPSNLDQKWWLRLAKVLYIGLYVLLFVLTAVSVALSLYEIRESLKEKRQQKELKARFEKATPIDKFRKETHAGRGFGKPPEDFFPEPEPEPVSLKGEVDPKQQFLSEFMLMDIDEQRKLLMDEEVGNSIFRKITDISEQYKFLNEMRGDSALASSLLFGKASSLFGETTPKGFAPFFNRGVTVLRIFLIVFAWMAVLRLMKIVFLYIALAQRPEWKKEFKKLF